MPPRKKRSISRGDDEAPVAKRVLPSRNTRATGLSTSSENNVKKDTRKKKREAVEATQHKSEARKFVGAHTSIAGGIENAVTEAVEIGASAFALFLRSQRTWACKPLEENSAKLFKAACVKHGFSSKYILPHGSYLVNLGSLNAETLRKSRDGLLDELQRCEMLGITQYNFHPGSTCGEMAVDECCRLIAEGINLALEQTSGVTAVVENMSRQGNTVGGHFEELRDIIAHVDDKSRVGVCLDTCHAFAAGYDIRTKEGFDDMMKEFDEIVGLKYLRGMHLNDSKGDLGCHLDRHENIGKGKIGLEAFRCIMNDPRLNDIPLILETPMGVSDAAEVELLRSLEGKDKLSFDLV